MQHGPVAMQVFVSKHQPKLRDLIEEAEELESARLRPREPPHTRLKALTTDQCTSLESRSQHEAPCWAGQETQIRPPASTRASLAYERP